MRVYLRALIVEFDRLPYIDYYRPDYRMKTFAIYKSRSQKSFNKENPSKIRKVASNRLLDLAHRREFNRRSGDRL